MKTDRFVKVMLVIIAGLLFLNCPNSNAPISDVFGTKTKAQVPSDLQKEKSYCFTLAEFGRAGDAVKIIEIDSKSAWIKVQSYDTGMSGCNSEAVSKAKLGNVFWLNTSGFSFVSEITIANK